MTDIFISYARKDQERAKVLAEALANQGWSVFWDRTIPPGKTWRGYIGSALEQARCVVVAWSADRFRISLESIEACSAEAPSSTAYRNLKLPGAHFIDYGLVSPIDIVNALFKKQYLSIAKLHIVRVQNLYSIIWRT